MAKWKELSCSSVVNGYEISNLHASPPARKKTFRASTGSWNPAQSLTNCLPVQWKSSQS